MDKTTTHIKTRRRMIRSIGKVVFQVAKTRTSSQS